MDIHDIVVLLNFAERCCHSKRFDVLPTVLYLFNSGTISRILYEELTRLFTEGDACLKIIMRLARECSFGQLVHALYMCNQAVIAEQLLGERYQRGSTVICSLTLTDGLYDGIGNFYGKLKSNLDNCVFTDKHDFLWKMAQHLKVEIRNHPPESSSQRLAADKLMVVHCLRLETFKTNNDRFSIIQDMHDDMKLAPATAIGHALFNYKLGSTYALEGDFQKADDLIREARPIVHATKPSFAVHYMYLHEVFTNLVQYKNNPTDEIKSRILFFGNRGLQSTKEDSSSDTRNITLILMMFMVFCLLGVGVDYGDIDVQVTDADREYARSLLVQFDWLSDNLESRREMAYCYLMCRLLWNEDRVRALYYGHRTLVLADSGVFRDVEKRNISKFVNR